MREAWEILERAAFERELRRVVREEPPNLETPPDALRSFVTPAELRFLRCHFPLPRVGPGQPLEIGGAVGSPLRLSETEVRALPSVTLTITTECAGNGRVSMRPEVDGEPWTTGAVSTAQWTGSPLRLLLERAGLRESAVEIVFGALDGGAMPDGSHASYERSLPLEKALDPDTLVAWEMNGAPIPREFGGPLRLIVPDWYGMASVKWLARILAVEEPFRGAFQVDRYVYAPGAPVNSMRIRSTFVAPGDGEQLRSGPNLLAGMAWGGDGGPVHVEIAIDGAWREARLVGPVLPHAWRRFELVWDAEPGAHVLRCRATDAAGVQQPDEPEWNVLGYGANGVEEIAVRVSAAAADRR